MLRLLLCHPSYNQKWHENHDCSIPSIKKQHNNHECCKSSIKLVAYSVSKYGRKLINVPYPKSTG